MVLSSIINGARSLVKPLIQPLFVPFLYWTLASLGTILSVWNTGDRVQDESEFLHPPQSKPYDFIIVGAGTAGCLLANRLSRYYSVLLIEAGGEPNPLQYIPQFSLFFPNYPDIDWSWRSVPQKYASLNSVNQEASLSAGIGLGGTGTLNYMIHLRGHKRDFDNWATLTGDPSWSWEGVLPFFKSYESYEIPGDNVNHGYRGDLRIETPDHPPSARLFVKAGVELGYPNVDLNAPFTEGFDILRYGMRRGVRQAPYKAFLEPVRFRASLTIMKFANVNKILFKQGNVAYGVEYDRHGRSYMAHARREVIISAGALATPKLLLLSGVGPKHHLSEFNIPVVSDVPVGENLMDHIGVYLAPFFINEGLGNYLDRDLTIGQFIKYFTLGRGRLTGSGCEAAGIFSSSYAAERGEADWPDITIFSYGFTNIRGGAAQLSRIFNLKYDEVEPYMRNDVGRDSLYIVVSGARPVSRGYVRLGGTSPYDKAIIDPNYLGDKGETDLKVLLEAVKTTVYMLENTTAGAVELGARFTTARLPGCEHLQFRSDEYWVCFIRRYSVTLHHFAGTASMGTVVDTELRVKGVRNLRVIDASIQPQVVTTNTQASTLMIAEKGADMMLRYWRSLDKSGGLNPTKRPYFGNGNYLGGGKAVKGGELGYKGCGPNCNYYRPGYYPGPVGPLKNGQGYSQPGYRGGNYYAGYSEFGVKPGNQNWGKRNIMVEASPAQGPKVRQHRRNVTTPTPVGEEEEYGPPIRAILPKHKVPSFRVDENLVAKQIQQTFEDLRMVSEIAKDNYGTLFSAPTTTKRPVSPKPTSRTTHTPSTTTTTTPPDSQYQDTPPSWESARSQQQAPQQNTNNNSQRDDSSEYYPAPPTPAPRDRKELGYYNTPASISPTSAPVSNKVKGVGVPNSLDYIEAYNEDSSKQYFRPRPRQQQNESEEDFNNF